jgi:hypothetical protein
MANLYTIENLLVGKTYNSKTLRGGPREIPRVAKVPEAAGKAASFALIKGAAVSDEVVTIKPVKNMI